MRRPLITVAFIAALLAPTTVADTGQPSFAASAAVRNWSASTPGTTPVTASADLVIPVPGTNVTVALASRLVGGVPAWASPCARAMQKHAA